MDVLTDVLRVAEMGNTMLGQSTFYAPWSVGVDPSDEIMLHYVRDGRCWLVLECGHPPIQLRAGDLLMLTRGTAHAICDRPGTASQPLDKVIEMSKLRTLDGAVPASQHTTLLCAKYRFRAPAPHPVASRLPEMIHIPRDLVVADPHLSLLLELLNLESKAQISGTELVVPRLVDSLLVFVLRAWLDGEGHFARSWFSALREPGISAALSAIHARPQQDWTIDELANIATQSRATFARRFLELVGEPPISYLTRWRMQVAARLLRDGGHRVEKIALEVGYESAAAFTKAFKRQFNVPPAKYRKISASSIQVVGAEPAQYPPLDTQVSIVSTG